MPRRSASRMDGLAESQAEPRRAKPRRWRGEAGVVWVLSLWRRKRKRGSWMFRETELLGGQAVVTMPLTLCPERASVNGGFHLPTPMPCRFEFPLATLDWGEVLRSYLGVRRLGRLRKHCLFRRVERNLADTHETHTHTSTRNSAPSLHGRLANCGYRIYIAATFSAVR